VSLKIYKRGSIYHFRGTIAGVRERPPQNRHKLIFSATPAGGRGVCPSLSSPATRLRQGFAGVQQQGSPKL
jgi:hypothetical protein